MSDEVANATCSVCQKPASAWSLVVQALALWWIYTGARRRVVLSLEPPGEK